MAAIASTPDTVEVARVCETEELELANVRARASITNRARAGSEIGMCGAYRANRRMSGVAAAAGVGRAARLSAAAIAAISSIGEIIRTYPCGVGETNAGCGSKSVRGGGVRWRPSEWRSGLSRY